ncbi:MAG: hypothetical protein A2Z93_00465 [Curvibacter sp. GWA2_64_110]|nr:MAG: hypothetical protein A2Z93_00465 [Curvibacter sp. GWA2_64_110]HCY17102.1 hypothetical protein [Curvibacter sp.]
MLLMVWRHALRALFLALLGLVMQAHAQDSKNLAPGFSTRLQIKLDVLDQVFHLHEIMADQKIIKGKHELPRSTVK